MDTEGWLLAADAEDLCTGDCWGAGRETAFGAERVSGLAAGAGEEGRLAGAGEDFAAGADLGADCWPPPAGLSLARSSGEQTTNKITAILHMVFVHCVFIFMLLSSICPVPQQCNPYAFSGNQGQWKRKSFALKYIIELMM
ncbi:MAG: hypothetical protein JXB18_09720 [Sedimentisphaerales bacterium]|nr:hypothetical protein [Sedimentisphaerales bacterium]